MKKCFLAILIVMCLIMSLMIVIHAHADDCFYGMLDRWGTTYDLDGEKLDFRILDSEGNFAIYTVANRVYVNNEFYKASEIYDEHEWTCIIPEGSFVRFVLNDDNEINRIDYDSIPYYYENVTYNEASHSFSGIDTSGLSVYYFEGEPGYDNLCFYKPYLDEEHYYDIEVYDYAVKIVDYTAKSYPCTITHIEQYNAGLDAEFNSQTICISAIATTEDEYMVFWKLNGQTYSKDCCGKEFYAEITDLANNIANYSLEIWIQNNEDEIITPRYKLNISTIKLPIYYGILDRWGTTYYLDGEKLDFRILDSEGNSAIYTVANRVYVNNEFYKASEIYDEHEWTCIIPEGSFVRFVLNDDNEINRIDYSDQPYSSNGIESKEFDFVSSKGRTDVIYNNNKVTVYVEFNYILKDAYVILGVYYKDKTLISTAIKNATTTDHIVSLSCQLDKKYTPGYIKLFFWDSLGELKPLGNALCWNIGY